MTLILVQPSDDTTKKIWCCDLVVVALGVIGSVVADVAIPEGTRGHRASAPASIDNDLSSTVEDVR